MGMRLQAGRAPGDGDRLPKMRPAISWLMA
jgi:hypothetical protein